MLASGGKLRMTAVMRMRTSGSRWTTRTIRASRARRKTVEFSRSPGPKARATAMKSKTFQPSRKYRQGRRP
jgi:hypothetical protein